MHIVSTKFTVSCHACCNCYIADIYQSVRLHKAGRVVIKLAGSGGCELFFQFYL